MSPEGQRQHKTKVGAIYTRFPRLLGKLTEEAAENMRLFLILEEGERQAIIDAMQLQFPDIRG